MNAVMKQPLMNPNLQTFWFTDQGEWQGIRYKILYGGRASSKSHDACGILTYISSNYKVKVLCTRMFQNKIAESVYTLIKNKITAFGLDDAYTITNNKIVCDQTGSEFIFYGIARNVEEIKSLEGINVCYLEEAQSITKEQWDIIIPTIRAENSEVWAIFNPDLVTDFIYNKFVVNTVPNAIVRMINYDENIFLTNTMREEIEIAKETMEEEDFNHVYLGQPKQDDDDAIIKRKWIMACVDAHLKLDRDVTGGKQVGYDVADSGDDLNAVVVMNGGLVEFLNSWKGLEDELFESSEKVFILAQQQNAYVNYDANGVGAGVGSNMKQMNRATNMGEVDYYAFDSGESPANPDSLYQVDGLVTQQTNRDYFENRKAQAWWLLADRIKATYRAVTMGKPIGDELISFSSDLDELQKLITELSTPRKAQSGRLKNMVEKKTDLKKRGIRSPNLADALVMASFRYNKKDGIQSFKVEI